MLSALTFVGAVFVSLKNFHFFKRGVFDTFLTLVLREECTNYQIDFTLMMFCMFQEFLLKNVYLVCLAL